MIRTHRHVDATYAEHVAQRMSAERGPLAARWLERLVELVPVDANSIFPTRALLDHIPLLIEDIAAYLRAPADLEIAANTSVIDKAQELGTLRYQQNASVHQILREYDILADLLEQFVRDETASLREREPVASDCLGLMQRLGHAVRTLMQTTVDTFVREYTNTIERQTEKLESFNRTLMHELRNPLSTLRFAVDLLSNADAIGDRDRYLRMVGVVRRNLGHAIDLVRGLGRIAFTERTVDPPNQQRISVASLAIDIARRLADMAETRGVDVRVDPDLPEILTDPAQLELVLMNLVTNAIKYSDPDKSPRYVEVLPAAPRAPDAVTICVRDNGIGIPSTMIDSVFARSVRAHADRDEELGTEGAGLGLAIVLDSVQTLGGTIQVESSEGEGTAFYIAVRSL
jgi:signal transduction histidine kinase